MIRDGTCLAVVVVTLAFASGCDSCDSHANEVTAYASVDQVFSEPILRHCDEAGDLSVRSPKPTYSGRAIR
ncbi:MAG: hypothetical protein JRH11_12500 [Deltaproteobacteria bacterium]|nr:hypothetical protein [Deltaproteobacteria bacterium]